MIFLLAAINVPVLSEYLKLTAIGVIPVIGLAILAIVITSWMELAKHINLGKY